MFGAFVKVLVILANRNGGAYKQWCILQNDEIQDWYYCYICKSKFCIEEFDHRSEISYTKCISDHGYEHLKENGLLILI